MVKAQLVSVWNHGDKVLLLMRKSEREREREMEIEQKVSLDITSYHCACLNLGANDVDFHRRGLMLLPHKPNKGNGDGREDNDSHHASDDDARGGITTAAPTAGTRSHGVRWCGGGWCYSRCWSR